MFVFVCISLVAHIVFSPNSRPNIVYKITPNTNLSRLLVNFGTTAEQTLRNKVLSK